MELLRIPAGDFEEDKDSVLLYDVAMKFCSDAMKPIAIRLQKGITLVPKEELNPHPSPSPKLTQKLRP